MRNSLVWTALVLMLLIALLFGWRVALNSAPPPPPMPPTQVATLTVTRRPLPLELRATGSLRAVRQVLLSVETPGRVTAIRFDAGNRVRQGKTILTLFDAPERADLAAARAKADFARIQFQRSTDLAPTGAEPRELLQQRKADYDQTRAAVAQIEARLIQKQVRAPFSGEIGIRRVNPGQYLNPGDGIATLTDLSALYGDFTVPQSDLGKLRVGMPVSITTDARPGRVFPARISAIEPLISSDTRNVTVQTTLANPDHFLRPGMYITARVQVASTMAIIVPTTAIQTTASGDTVVIARDLNRQGVGKADVIPVKLGTRIGDDVVVEQGLRAGDVVVIAGQLRIPPGGPIQTSGASAPSRH